MDIEYYTRWPCACKVCNATGLVYDEPEFWYSDYGYDPCPECNQLGKCPRCGLQFTGDAEDIFFEEKSSCPQCGYNHGKNKDDFPQKGTE